MPSWCDRTGGSRGHESSSFQSPASVCTFFHPEQQGGTAEQPSLPTSIRLHKRRACLILVDLVSNHFLSIHMDIPTLRGRPRALHLIVFLQAAHRPIWLQRLCKSCWKQNKKNEINGFHSGGGRRGLPFRIWQPCFKLCQVPALPPPAAGMSPLAQRNFITLPSLCCGVTGGQKPALTPWGHLLGSPPRCTLWLWHNFAVRRHKSLCRGVFCVSGQSVKERKENNPDAFSETAQLAPFYNASGGQLCSDAVIAVVFRETNFSKRIPMSCN